MKTSKRLWIIEGPGGAGKTTLARALVDAIGGHCVRFGPFPHINRENARPYVDAMMPAVLGMSDVVMDSSWLSERPYSVAYRHGAADRLGPAVRALERLAWRCQTVVVICLPPWDTVAVNIGRRAEHLYTLEELHTIYDLYRETRTSLPMVTIDPFDRPAKEWIDELRRHPGASVPHALNVPSVGNLRGKVTLVDDPRAQWPFSGERRDEENNTWLDEEGNAWLATQLDAAQISERDLFWINADALTPAIRDHRAPIVALGDVAAHRLIELGRTPDRCVPHPRNWMHSFFPYPLIDALKSLIEAPELRTRAHDFGVPYKG